MIETTTTRSIKTDYSNQIETRGKSKQAFQATQFQNTSSKNPCHDGCNVKPEQLQSNRGETSKAEAVENDNTASEESGGIEKTSGGNCPGSALIANILESLIQSLEATNTSRET